MPEELRDLMNRAARGPAEEFDADQVWKKGSRRRMVRRSAMAAAAVLTAVVLVGGVVVISGNSSRDADLAGLEGDERTAVETFLDSLEEQGVLEIFPDSRAAVEYAQRNDCFAGVDAPAVVSLAQAVDELAAALEIEGFASAVSVGAGQPVSASVLSRSDSAIEVYRVAVDGLGDVDDEAFLNAVETVTARLGDAELLRPATSRAQMSGSKVAEQYIDLAAAAVDVLDLVPPLMDDAQGSREVDNLVDLMRSRNSQAGAWSLLGWAVAGPGTFDADADGGSAEADAFAEALQSADDYKVRFEESATPEQKSFLRNQISAEEVRDGVAILNSVLGGLESGNPAVLDAVAINSVTGAASAEARALSDVTETLVDDLPEASSTTFGSEVDAAVASACERAGPLVLSVDASEVG